MMEVVNAQPQAFKAFLHEENERWAPVRARDKITLA